MGYKEIIQRAASKRKRYDHIGWRAICPRCGLNANILGPEVRDKFGDAHADLRKLLVQCRSPRCAGKMKILYKMGEERAVHLSDIQRR